MPNVRLFKTGGETDNDKDKGKKSQYINFDGVDYDVSAFKDKLSNIDGFSSWADSKEGMSGSKIRNAVMQRAAEMGRALIDGKISYDGITKFSHNNPNFASTGRTKKKWFSGNYNSKDINTVNAIASNYILGLLRDSKAKLENNNPDAEKIEDLTDYDVNSEYGKRFDSSVIKSLGAGANQYISNELNEIYDYINSDEAKKKYTQNSLLNASNEINRLKDFYSTYTIDDIMKDDKVKSMIASISLPLYQSMYNSTSQQQQTPQQSQVDAEMEKIKKEQEEQDKIAKLNEQKENLENTKKENEYQEYKRNYSIAQDYTPFELRAFTPASKTQTNTDFLNLINTIGGNMPKYSSEFYNQLTNRINELTGGDYNEDSISKFNEWLNKPYDYSILGNYVGNWKPASNYEIVSNILSRLGTNGKIALNNSVSKKTGNMVGIDFTNPNNIRIVGANPLYMKNNGFIDESGYDDALRFIYGIGPKKNKDGGVIVMQYGGMFNDYASIQYDVNNLLSNDERALLDEYINRQNDINNKKEKTKDAAKRSYNGNNKAYQHAMLNAVNEDGSWNLDTNDYIKLSSSIADVASLAMSFIPGLNVAGGIAGVAGSVGNFISDWKEDQLDWGDIGRFGMNLGADLIGFVPGLGTSAKMTKALKSAKNLIPVFNTVIAANQIANENSDLHRGLRALTNLGTTGYKMTVQDWKDLANGLTTLSSLALGFKGQRNVNKGLNKLKTNNVTINVKKSGVNKKAVLSMEDLSELDRLRMNGDKKLSYRDALEAQNKYIKERFGDDVRLDDVFSLTNTRFGKYNNIVNSRKYSSEYNIKDKDGNNVGLYDYIYSRNNPTPKPTTTTNKNNKPEQLMFDPELEYKKGGKLIPVGRFRNGGVIYKFRSGGATVRNTIIGDTLDKSYGSYNASWGDSVGRYIEGELNRLKKLKDSDDQSFESERQKFMDNVYNIQKSYKGMNDKSGFGWGKDPLSRMEEVSTHQKMFNDNFFGANTMIDKYGNIVPVGNSGDNAEGGYNDGLNGNKNSLRNIGYSNSAENDALFQKGEMFSNISNLSKDVGMRYDARNDLSGNGNNYYTFQIAGPDKIEQTKSSLYIPKADPTSGLSISGNTINTEETNPGNLKDKEVKSPMDLSMLTNITDIWKPIVTNQINNQITNDRLKNLRPTLVSAPRRNAKVYNDYMAEKAGENEAARYNMIADRMAGQTSDLITGANIRFAGASNAYDAREKSRIISDKRYKDTMQNVIDTNNYNTTVGVQAANQNMGEMNRIADLKSQLRAQNKVMNLNNWMAYVNDKQKKNELNRQILYNRDSQLYDSKFKIDYANKLKELKNTYGDDIMNNEDAMNDFEKFKMNYLKNAPLPPLYVKKGGSISRRTSLSINFGFDKFAKEYFKDSYKDRKILYDHIKDVADANSKERKIAARSLTDFNKVIAYAKKNKK